MEREQGIIDQCAKTRPTRFDQMFQHIATSFSSLWGVFEGSGDSLFDSLISCFQSLAGDKCNTGTSKLVLWLQFGFLVPSDGGNSYGHGLLGYSVGRSQN